MSSSFLSDDLESASVDHLELTTGWLAHDFIAFLALTSRLTVREKDSLLTASGAGNFDIVRVWSWDGSSELVSSLLDVLWQVE